MRCAAKVGCSTGASCAVSKATPCATNVSAGSAPATMASAARLDMPYAWAAHTTGIQAAQDTLAIIVSLASLASMGAEEGVGASRLRLRRVATGSQWPGKPVTTAEKTAVRGKAKERAGQSSGEKMGRGANKSG